LQGRSLIGLREGTKTSEVFRATDPATGQDLAPEFHSASREEVDQAVCLAARAFEVYRRASGIERGTLLRKIAAGLEAIASTVAERAQRETALPQVRLQSEMARTCGQLRLFAQVAEEGCRY
jgi:2,5-dioxopentanoate dehydrogenase